MAQSFNSHTRKQTLPHPHTHLFGGLLGAIVDPPAQAGPPAGDVATHLKLPCHRVAHDSAGDVGGHLGDRTLELVQHGLHVGAVEGQGQG